MDACVAMYNNVSMMRQQIKMTDRIHCVISKGGDRPNVIPHKTESWYQIPAITNEDFEVLKNKLINCAKAAETATGTHVFLLFPISMINCLKRKLNRRSIENAVIKYEFIKNQKIY